MTPETAESMHDSEHTRRLLEEAERDVRESDEVAAEVERDLEASEAETDEAVETLRRAGLLPA